MFDFEPGKLIIIGIVALIVIGPKDLPRVLRELGKAVGKMRRMASEFQAQFMEAVREADMADLKDEVAKLAESAKVNLPTDPLAGIKSEIASAIETTPAAPASSASASDLLATDAEISSSSPAFPQSSESPSEASGPGKESTRASDDSTADGASAQDAPQQSDTGVDAEMRALASALKAEMGASPKPEPARAPDLLRRHATLHDDA